jgi:carboxypeptidase Q
LAVISGGGLATVANAAGLADKCRESRTGKTFMTLRPLAIAVLIAATPAVAADRMAEAVALREAALAKSEALPMLTDLTTTVGPRLAATPAEARGREWAMAAMKKAGLVNIHTEAFPMPVWNRGAETAEVTGTNAQKLVLAALGNSGATPAAGITAPVMYFADIAALQAAAPGSLKGKIAFIDHRMMRTQDGSSYGVNGIVRRSGPSIAASRGAVATLIRSLGTDYHRNPHTGGTVWAKDQAPIPAAALALPDSEQLARLAQAGPVSIHLTLTPTYDPKGESANVVGEIPGTSDETIVIGGHLDSWDLAQGVIDDGAGMAITLAAAKAIKDSGLQPRRTVRVVFWGAEEPGLWGGRAYAEKHKTENIVLAAESDFGADRVYRIGSRVAEAGLPLIAEIAEALAPLGIAPSGDNMSRGDSDTGPMIPNGVGMLSLEQDGTRYFDYHHTPDDTLDKVDRAQIDQNVAAYAAAVWLAASDDRPLRTK